MIKKRVSRMVGEEKKVWETVCVVVKVYWILFLHKSSYLHFTVNIPFYIVGGIIYFLNF